ncbi:30S ribosomal protein S3ae [archaeon SCG-AAA382B04]|nr:30S ribosomal protein S3ae [archaeon SCG-AAA382B04]
MSRKSGKSFGWQAKKWYEVIAPEIFGEDKIGETPAEDPEKVIGRIIETTVGDLTGDFSKNNTKVYFKIKEISGEQAKTQFIGHELTSDYVDSLVRRRTNKLDITVDVLTKDGYKMRVKPVIFTVKRGKSSQKNSLRLKGEEVIKEKAKQEKFKQFSENLVLGELASEIYKEAKSIYPLRRVEIRKSEVINEPSDVEEVPDGFQDVADKTEIEVTK